jgi:hypothetical protein
LHHEKWPRLNHEFHSRGRYKACPKIASQGRIECIKKSRLLELAKAEKPRARVVIGILGPFPTSSPLHRSSHRIRDELVLGRSPTQRGEKNKWPIARIRSSPLPRSPEETDNKPREKFHHHNDAAHVDKPLLFDGFFYSYHTQANG